MEVTVHKSQYQSKIQFVTLSELGHGDTTSMITLSTLTMPSGLALAHGYANIFCTRPRDSLHLTDLIFPPIRLLRVSGETAEENAQPGMMDIPISEEHREPCFRDTVPRGQGKLHRGRDFSPLIPPAAPHSTFNSSNVDRLHLGGERIPSVASERFGRAHSEPELLSSRGGPVRDGLWTFTLNSQSDWGFR